MKVIVRHADSSVDSSSELHVEDGETWGRLCQRFVETRLPHPPRLLQLLASLHPDERLGRYRFRYGDGNSTVIEPTWSIAGHNSSAPIICSCSKEGGADVEANVTLRCDSRECSPREKADCEEWDDGALITVRLHIEKVGGEDDDDDDDESLGVLPFLSYDVEEVVETTQTPFPVDDGETSVLKVREHVRFAGVVDKISISKYLESDDREEEEGGKKKGSQAIVTEVVAEGATKDRKGKKRKQKKDKRTSAESAKKSNKGDKMKKEQSATKRPKRAKKVTPAKPAAAPKTIEEITEDESASDEAPTTESPASRTRSKKKNSKGTPQKKAPSAKASPAEITPGATVPTPTSNPRKKENNKPKKSKEGGAVQQEPDCTDQKLSELKQQSSNNPGSVSKKPRAKANAKIKVIPGRRGDPRMNQAVQAKVSNPSLSLVDALVAGGFVFPNLNAPGIKNVAGVKDEDGVTVYQKRNQLLRRLRYKKVRVSKA